jgi:non-heme Fe2+,alpha-ketoglutarate-dependent halogenase
MSQIIYPISVADYKADGFIERARLITEYQASEVRGSLEEFIQHYGDDPRFGDWCYFKSSIILPWVIELATAPGVVDAVKCILGPDILLWNSSIPIKPPESEGHFAWHQDATYWHLTPVEEMVTIWLSLSRVTPESGSMRFLPNSHHQGQIPHEMTKGTKSMLRRGQRVLGTFDESTAVACTLQPGEASIHHPFTLHCSASNRSDQWRLGVALNFVSANVSPKPGFTESALYISGEDRNESFERDPVPASVLSEASIIALDHAISLAAARYSDV